jgi:hypothetical protein
MQESLLDNAAEKKVVADCIEIFRRDHKIIANRGGILTLQKKQFNELFHIKDCE